MYTLGINAAFHDSSACIVKDGKLLAAAEDERFTHIKHGKRPIPFSTYELPYHAINFCLAKAGIHISQIDYFAYSFNPSLLSIDDSRGLQLPRKASEHDDWNHLFYSSII